LVKIYSKNEKVNFICDFNQRNGVYEKYPPQKTLTNVSGSQQLQRGFNPDIKSENGILVFENQEMLDKELLRFHLQKTTDYLYWQNKLGFSSLYTIYEEIAKQEYDLLVTPYENKTDEEMKNIPNPGHSKAYKNAVLEKVILEMPEENGATSPKMNCSQINYSPFLNKNGFVKVGSDLYQYIGDYIKCMKNGNTNENNLIILNNAKYDDASKGISVINLVKESRANGVINLSNILDNSCNSTPSCFGWNNDGSRRTCLNVIYTINWDGINLDRAIAHGFNISVNSKTQYRNFWNSYVDEVTKHTFNRTMMVGYAPQINSAGTPIINSFTNSQYLFNYGSPIANTSTASFSDNFNGGSVSFIVTVASNQVCQAPIINQPPLALVQSYFKNPSAIIDWTWTANVTARFNTFAPLNFFLSNNKP
jgi:hypothetical protein